MDAFFTSVEQLDFPELRGHPVVVGGRSKRAVVAAASYEARRFGIHSAMPMYKAMQLCPQLLIQPHRFDRYVDISKTIRHIFSEYTELVEPLSIDEAYLDITSNKKNEKSAKAVAKQIKDQIKTQTGLTCSAGISINKFLAKMASDLRKPDGLSIIHPDKIDQFVRELRIDQFYGIGKVTASKMVKIGINTGADLQTYSRHRLIQLFGKVGNYYYDVARGIDDREVNPVRKRKSYSLERTFEDNIEDVNALTSTLELLADKLWENLEERHLAGRTLTVKIKFADFKIITRSKTLPSGFTTLLLIKEAIRNDLISEIHPPFSIRLLGLGVSNLMTPEETSQISITFDL